MHDNRLRNILLISPASDNELLWVTGDEGPQVKNNIFPLGLATVAGLTPESFRLDIWDELVHGVIDENTKFDVEYDMVGVTGYKAHLPRCRELANIFRSKSIPVVIGGPGVSGTPAEYYKYFDVLFIGEVEKTWPQFLLDWQAGSFRQEYRQIEKIDLAESPLPRWDSIAADVSNYAMGSVQTTRGCPFDCEFCDVIYLFGRRPRQKPVQNVLEEVKNLERLGVRSIFFCDDEFIGNRKYAIELLKELVLLNNSFENSISFSTQLTMNVSKSEELLGLLADANFNMVFIGIETPNKESLKESNKIHNISTDFVKDIHKILSYGLAIRAGIIVGFDHDDLDIFDIQYEFIQKAFIPSVAINMLKVPSGTRLWARMREEGRVISISPDVRGRLGHPRSYTTIIPKTMSRVELMKGYKRLLERIISWESFSERMNGFISVVHNGPMSKVKQPSSLNNIQFSAVPDTEPEERAIIDTIIKNTVEKTPFMIQRIKALIVQHAKYKKSIDKLLPQLDRQIELESTGALTFEVDDSPIPINTAFREAYKELFPEVYRRIYLNLNNKEQVSAALMDVFVAFLMHCGDGFTLLEESHRMILKDICDGTCARMNTQSPDEFVAIEDDDAQIPDHRRIGLSDDVLKSVEQGLIKNEKFKIYQ